MQEEKEKMCECGHDESMHIDGCEECIDVECGCTEFEENMAYEDVEETPYP